MTGRLILMSCVLVGCGASTPADTGVPIAADAASSDGGADTLVGLDGVGDSDGPTHLPDGSVADSTSHLPEDVSVAPEEVSAAPEDVSAAPEDVSAAVEVSQVDASPPVSDAGGEPAMDVASWADTALPDAGAVEGPVELPYDPCAAENLSVDTDGDGWSDCDELSDELESTDPTRFNGLTATIGVPPEGFLSSAQCGLFFGTDYGELDQHFAESDQSMSIRAGWEYSAGNTAEYDDAESFDFDPNWANSENIGVWDSFQILFTGWVYLDQDTTYCFSVDTGAGGIGPGDIAGRRNNCGLFYINPQSASAPLAETGYGSNESPHVGCAAYEVGWHQIAIAARHYETYFYAPKLAIRSCYSDNPSCNPTTPLPQEQMWSDAEPTPLPETVTVGPVDEPDGVTPETDDASAEPDVGPSAGEGACTNASDSSVIDALGVEGLEQGITDCGMPCFFDGDKQQCITDCIASDLGLSAECALCYAVPAACAMANCVSECIDGGDDCDQCMADNGCQDDFSACSGLDG